LHRTERTYTANIVEWLKQTSKAQWAAQALPCPLGCLLVGHGAGERLFVVCSATGSADTDAGPIANSYGCTFADTDGSALTDFSAGAHGYADSTRRNAFTCSYPHDCALASANANRSASGAHR
jgi:hypothetical protein